MPGIGSLIREIDVKMSEIRETNIPFLLSKTNTRILSVKGSRFEVVLLYTKHSFGFKNCA